MRIGGVLWLLFWILEIDAEVEVTWSQVKTCEDVSFNSSHNALRRNRKMRKNENTSTYHSVPIEWVWRNYRLGDAIRGYGNQSSAFICQRWPGSLACKYRSVTESPMNIGVLNGLVEDVTVNVTAVHLRLGDVVTTPRCWEELCNATKHARNFVATKELYESIIADIPKNDPVVFVGSPYHHGTKEKIKNSLLYLRKVICFFRHQGFEASYNGDNTLPDDDFVLLTTAKTFVQGGGGFSMLVSMVASQRNHKVIRIESIAKSPY